MRWIFDAVVWDLDGTLAINSPCANIPNEEDLEKPWFREAILACRLPRWYRSNEVLVRNWQFILSGRYKQFEQLTSEWMAAVGLKMKIVYMHARGLGYYEGKCRIIEQWTKMSDSKSFGIVDDRADFLDYARKRFPDERFTFLLVKGDELHEFHGDF